jgi:hypothetical protein
MFSANPKVGHNGSAVELMDSFRNEGGYPLPEFDGTSACGAQSGHSAKSRWPVSRRGTFARILKLKLPPTIDHVRDVVTRRLGHSSYPARV